MAEIIVTREGQGVERYLINKDRMTIGRSVSNDIVLEDLSVSRSHAEISVEGGRFFLTDMGSANGSRVNGVSITDTELFHDDVILIGESTLLFVTTQSETEPVAEETWEPPVQQIETVTEPDVAFLTVRCPRQRPQLHAVSGAAAQIGRARDNEVRVADWFVEPYQAQLLRESGRFRLINLSAETPVFRNEELVEDVLLEDGDVIQMGMSQIAFAVQDEAAREVETQKTAPEPEEPRVAATEFRAYGADSGEPTPGPTPFDAEVVAELDQAIDQVLDEAALHSEAAEEEPDQIASARTEQPSVEPWDRWAEELAEIEPVPDNAPETTPETAETDLQSIEEETSAAEEFPEMSPVASSSPEEQAFADLEGLVESDEEYRPTPVNENWNAPLSEEDAEFLASAFAPVETTPGPEPEPILEPESAVEEPIEESAPVASTLNWVEEPGQEETGDQSEEDGLEETGDESPAPESIESPAAQEVGPSADVDPAKVAFWEKALLNPSPAVVKQAREQLKRLTGRDYDL